MPRRLPALTRFALSIQRRPSPDLGVGYFSVDFGTRLEECLGYFFVDLCISAAFPCSLLYAGVIKRQNGHSLDIRSIKRFVPPLIDVALRPCSEQV